LSKIFLCYRRDDSRQASGRLYDGLTARLGEDSVFRDVYSIEFGTEWRDRIGEFMEDADILLAIIGHEWDITRLADSEDVLGHELRLARERGLPIIPVLVDGADLPSKDQLPEALSWIAGLQSAPLRDGDYAYDFERLLTRIGQQLGVDIPRAPGASIRPRTLIAGVVTAILASVGAYAVLGPDPPDPVPPGDEERAATVAPSSCSLPARDVFADSDISVRFAEVDFPRFAVGRAPSEDFDSAAGVRLAESEPISEYVLCQATVRDGFDPAQARYLNDLLTTLEQQSGTATSAAETEMWLAANPFPEPLPAHFADVVVAELDDRSGGTRVDVAGRIAREIQDQFEAYGLRGVTARAIPTLTEDEAQAQAGTGWNRVIIWGWRDDLDVNLEIMLGSAGDAAEARDLNLSLPRVADWESFGFAMRESLPSNTSFLSLFLVGLLRYQENAYSDGFRAFNAAMDQMPDAVVIENEGLRRFFEARRLDTSGSGDKTGILCGYAAALRADSTMYFAYNNIATVLSEGAVEGLQVNEATLVATPEGLMCLEEAGILSRPESTGGGVGPDYHYSWDRGEISADAVRELLDRMEAAVGPMALIDYNRVAVRWNTDDNREADHLEIRAELERIIGEDPSIPGPYLILGVLDFDGDDLVGAADNFQRYLDWKPDDPDVLTNLGQVRLNQGDLEGARSAFQQARAIRPDHREATFALAGVAVRDRDLDGASQLLEALPDTGRFSAPFETLRGIVLAEQGGVPPEQRDALPAYVHAIALERAGRQDEADTLWVRLDGYFGSSGATMGDENRTVRAAWSDLLDRCSQESERVPGLFVPTARSTWGTSDPCMPTDLDARLGVVRDAYLAQMAMRLWGREAVKFVGAACPYVYTWDETVGEWVMDTAVLVGVDAKERESTQSRPLARFDGRLMIREVEPEVSHIDRVHVEGVDAAGRVHVFEADHAALAVQDGEYLILREGQELLLDFPTYDPSRRLVEFRVVAHGYYVPLY